jgi:hypothetical protein
MRDIGKANFVGQVEYALNWYERRVVFMDGFLTSGAAQLIQSPTTPSIGVAPGATSAFYGVRCPNAMPTANILVRVGGREYNIVTGSWAQDIVRSIVNTVNSDTNRTVDLAVTGSTGLNLPGFDGNRSFRVVPRTPGADLSFEIAISLQEPPDVEFEIRLFAEDGTEIGLMERAVTRRAF